MSKDFSSTQQISPHDTTVGVMDLLYELKAKVDRIDNKLFVGNGQPSLLQRVAVIETKMDADDGAKNKGSAWLVAIISGVVASVVLVITEKLLAAK